jgi:curved DNA-binding protein CbpA
MSRAEALTVLGLQEGATEGEIRAAHRRLILQTHPDKGGTNYLAAKINEAKDVLLRRR